MKELIEHGVKFSPHNLKCPKCNSFVFHGTTGFIEQLPIQGFICTGCGGEFTYSEIKASNR